MRSSADAAPDRDWTRSITDGLADVVYALQLEPVRQFEYLSPSITQLLGYTPEDLYADVTLVDSVLDPGDMAEVTAAVSGPDGVPFDLITRLRTATGETRWVHRRSRRIRREDGSLVVIGIARDVTEQEERRRAQEEQERNSDHAHLVIDALLDPVVLLRAVRDEAGAIVDFTYVEANEAACIYLARSAHELLGRQMRELFDGSGAGVVVAELAGAIDTQEPVVLDNMAFPGRADADQLHIDLRGVPVADTLVLSWRDVTDRVAAARAIAASEARYRLLAEHAADVVALGSNEGQIQWVSPAIKTAAGWSPEDLVGRLITELIHPDDLPQVAAVQPRVLHGHETSFEARLRTKEGHYSWMAVRVVPTFDEHGAVTGRIGSWRVADKEHAAREALAASEARYRILAENASDVVGELSIDGHVLWGSPSMATLYGWDADRWSTLSIADFLDPDDLPLALSTMQTILEHGIEQSVRLHMRAADGTPHTMLTLARPVKADGEHVSSIIVGLRDVTREDAAITALEASEEHFRQIVEHINDVVAIVSPERRVTWVSPSVTATLGWQPEQLVGMLVGDLLSPEDEAQFNAPDGPDPEQPPFVPPMRPVVVRISDHEGQRRWMSMDASAIRAEDGTLQSVVATLRDIDELVRTTQQLSDERMRLQVTLNSLLDPHVLLVAVRDDLGTIVDFIYGDVNDAACEYMQLSRDQLDGARLRDLLPSHAGSGMLAMYAGAVESGTPIVLDDFSYDDEGAGSKHYFDVRGVKVGDGLIITWRNVTERHSFESQLNRLATRDPLTGLTNRAQLLEQIDAAVVEARASGTLVAVALLDLDHFKDINDTLGHGAGDALLKSASARIEHAVKQSDVVGRLGGDEFVVLVRSVGVASDAVQCVERVLATLRDPFVVEGNTLYATASAGISVMSDDASAIEGGAPLLLREADIALYEAKAAGRDCWAIFSEGLRAEVTARVAIGSELRTALARDELMMWYQPDVDLTTGKVRAVEALVRWNHPDGHVRGAGTFIGVAESSGLILEIGEWVIRQSFLEAATIVAMRPDDPVTVRVNLAAAQFSGDLVHQIDAALAASGVPPELICLEITESALVRDLAFVRETLETLRTRGLRFAIDDFGAGYASLTYLRDFPVELIKIDRSFLIATEDDDRTWRLVRAIVTLADQLGIAVTAEGVETREQAAFLRRIGCPTAQGYLFAPAVPIPTLRPLIENGFGPQTP